MQKSARGGRHSQCKSARGGGAMLRHRSASIDLRSTTANYRGAQAWWPVHQLSSTLSVCQELLHCAPVSGSRHHSSHPAPHRSSRHSNRYGLFVECLRSTTATAVPTKFVQASSLRCCDLLASFSWMPNPSLRLLGLFLVLDPSLMNYLRFLQTPRN